MLVCLINYLRPTYRVRWVGGCHGYPIEEALLEGTYGTPRPTLPSKVVVLSMTYLQVMVLY